MKESQELLVTVVITEQLCKFVQEANYLETFVSNVFKESEQSSLNQNLDKVKRSLERLLEVALNIGKEASQITGVVNGDIIDLKIRVKANFEQFMNSSSESEMATLLSEVMQDLFIVFDKLEEVLRSANSELCQVGDLFRNALELFDFGMKIIRPAFYERERLLGI